jgi:predicted phage tail protein
MSRPPIRGAGGGGKGGGGGSTHVPTEAPDSLRSRAYARVIDAISEGEIEGLVAGLQSIYLDDTPIGNPDGSTNFSGVSVITRNGTQAQDYIPGFAAVESEIAVATEVKAATPVVRSVSNVNLSAVRVTVSVPQLTYQNPSTGDLAGTSVEIAIDVNNNGGGWQEVKRDTISGKTTSRYQRSYRIDLPAPGPWDIRMRRITPDSTQSNLQNKTFWDSYTEIIDAKLAYPNTALVAIQIDAAQFNRIPRRGYDIKGLRVRVPTNYDPGTRSYSGVWDGTFKIAWTDNPAWCFYDLLTSERYGLGAYIDPAQVDKWALYEIGRYCDELVPDGFGGVEPRFACNLYLQTRQEALTVIGQMASIFRGMAWWSQGALTAVADMPSDPVALFTPANVVDGAFTYSGSSVRSRHTVALVTWNDPSDMYRQKIEYVEDVEGIARYGVQETEIVAVGCASRGQAHRVGRWLLYTERMETETVTFRCGLEGVYLYPGAVIQVQDAFRAGRRFGGRIVSATAGSVTLDAPVTIEAGKSYQLSVQLPDGTVETRAVTTGAGSQAVLTVSPAFSAAPQAQAVWVLAASDLAPTTWRVVSVREVEPGMIIEVTALAHRPEKYAAIEQDLVLEPLPVSSLSAGAPMAPQNLVVTEALYLVGPGIVGAKANLSWDAVLGADRYEVSWRDLAGGNPQTVVVTAPSYDIAPIQPGTHEFAVRAVDSLGRRSLSTIKQQTIYGKTLPPADVAELQLAALGGHAHLTFAPAVDLDVIVGGSLRVRHSPLLTGASWTNAVDIGAAIPGSATSAVLPLLSGTYLAKWVDSSGNESVNAKSVSTDAPDVLALNVVDTVTEHPSWVGTKNGVAYGLDWGGIKLDSVDTVASRTDNVGVWPRLSILGGVRSSGEYISTTTVDLGAVYTSRLTARLYVETIDEADTIAGRTDDVSLWPSIVGQMVTDATARLYVRTTNDDPGASPTWSAWQPFVVADWTARAFQFRLVLESASRTHNVVVKELEITVDMPDRIEQDKQVASGVGTKTITFTLPFKAVKAIAITAENMQTGDYYEVTNRSVSGFNVTFRNASGSPVNRTFDWIAKGY